MSGQGQTEKSGAVRRLVGIEVGVVSGCSTSNRLALTRRAGDYAMKKHTTRPDSATAAAETAPHLFDNWFDPIEFGVRSLVRDFIETMMEEELEAVLSDCIGMSVSCKRTRRTQRSAVPAHGGSGRRRTALKTTIGT
jgi:hypothetical protein